MNIIPLECAKCGTKLKIKTGFGKVPSEIRCTKCGEKILVPKPAPDAEAGGPATPSPSPAPATAAAAAATPPPTTSEPTAAKAPEAPTSVAAEAGPTIRFACPGCQREITVKSELGGKKLRCKQCGRIVPIPPAPKPTGPTAPAAPEADVAVPPPPPLAEPPAPVPVTPPPPPAVPAPPMVAETPILTPPPPAPVRPMPPPPPAAPPRPEPPAVNPALETATARVAVLEAQIADLHGKLHGKDAQVATAEMRAVNAEKSLHELASQKAMEGAAAARKLGELEARVHALQQAREQSIADCRAELEAAEHRVAVLRERLQRLTAI